MKILTHTLIAAALLGLGSSAMAAGWVKILKNTPAEAFEDEDLRMFMDNARQTLDAEGEPQLAKWSNPATGAGGSFKVLKQMSAKNGAACKRVHLTIYAKSRAEKGATATACQTADKRWLLGEPK